MAFKEDVQKLASKVMQNKAFIKSEESTKQSLVIPFINILGYDTSNPIEFQSEYSAGFDKEREKVDYAILKDNKIIMLVEVKMLADILVSYDKQLAKYFNSTREVKFAIITNGVKYKFYSDLNDPNMIDELPFFEFDFDNINENDIEILQHFCKDEFEVERMLRFADELAYSSKMKPVIIELLRNPSDDLVRLIIKKIDPEAKVSSSIVSRYRETTKNAITDAMIEMFRQGIVQKNEIIPESEIAREAKADKMAPSVVNKEKEDNGSTIKNNQFPQMLTLFEWGLIRIGDFVYLKNHPQEKAQVVNKKEVQYQGKILSFYNWGKQVTGWKSICIYEWMIVDGQTQTLDVLRRNKIKDLEKA